MEKDEIKNLIQSTLNCDTEEFYKKYKKYKKAEKEFKEIYEPFKKGLIKLYEEHKELPNIIIIGGAKLIYVSPSVRTSIDTKKLKEEQPELAKKFSKTTSVDATFRLEEV